MSVRWEVKSLRILLVLFVKLSVTRQSENRMKGKVCVVGQTILTLCSAFVSNEQL